MGQTHISWDIIPPLPKTELHINHLTRLMCLSAIVLLSSLAVGQSTGHAFLWTASGGMQDLGALPGWQDSLGQGINQFGDVVGYNVSGASAGFGWSSPTGMRYLSGLSRTESQGDAINDAKQVVGSSVTKDGGLRAFLWSPKGGVLDLGDLGGGSSEALAINNSGPVVGYSSTAADLTRPFIWTQGAGMQDLISLTENCPSCEGEAWGIN